VKHPLRRNIIFAVALGVILTAMLVVLMAVFTPKSHADDPLAGSDQVLFLGPTWIPNPSIFPGYESTVDRLYLEQLGFSEDGHISTLVTPETPDFGPSIGKGVDILVHAVEADYNTGTISADEPLTITAYSQSTVIVSQAELILAAYGVPSQDLDFVLLGDAAAPTGILSSPLGIAVDDLFGWKNLNNTLTPNDLYPTQEFVVPHDFWADTKDDTNLLSLAYGFFDHGDYLGVSESTVQQALTDGVTDGLTTTYTLNVPDSLGGLIDTLLQTALNDIGF
jgi:hypothetical protein